MTTLTSAVLQQVTNPDAGIWRPRRREEIQRRYRTFPYLDPPAPGGLWAQAMFVVVRTPELHEQARASFVLATSASGGHYRLSVR